MHRLRRLRAGLSGLGDLRARRPAGKVVGLHRQERRVLRPVGGAGRVGLPDPHLPQLHGRALSEAPADLVVEVLGHVFGGGIQHVERGQIG